MGDVCPRLLHARVPRRPVRLVRHLRAADQVSCLLTDHLTSYILTLSARENGLVTSAASDWALDLASYPMSVMIAAGGLSAAIFGKWTIKVTHPKFCCMYHYDT